MYFIIAFILAICFCLSVNSFLLGAIKTTIGFFGNVLALILVGLSFYFYDWKIGGIAIAIYISAGFFFRPLGARIAAWLLRNSPQSHVEGKYIGLPSRRLYKLSKNISNYTSQSFSKGILSEKRDPRGDLIDFCYSLPQIKELLSLHGRSKEYLAEIYRAIILNGGGQWVGGHYIAASSLAYPETVQYFLTNGVNGITVINALMYFERGIPLGTVEVKSTTDSSSS